MRSQPRHRREAPTIFLGDQVREKRPGPSSASGAVVDHVTPLRALLACEVVDRGVVKSTALGHIVSNGRDLVCADLPIPLRQKVREVLPRKAGYPE